MKKFLISLVLSLAVFFGLYYFREPILDLLPIDRSGWVERDGSWYLLDEKGDVRTGWVETEEGKFYFRPDGAIHTGWLDRHDGKFYFSEDGILQTGWVELNGDRFFLDQQGTLVTGLLEQEGKRYYLNENGNPVSGFYEVDGETCYIHRDGGISSGWLELEEGCYYLKNSVVTTGWLEENGSSFYLDETGLMTTGWTETPEGTFYMLDNGALATGWTEIDGIRYCFDEAGLPRSGWVEEDGARYYLTQEGTLAAGWQDVDGQRYYIREDGTPAVGKLEIDGETYFFSSTGMNFIMVNPWNELPEGFDVELVQTEGAWLDPVCKDALEEMMADCRAAGYSPMVKSSYRSIADQRANLDRMIANMGGDYAAATKIVAVPGTSEHHLGLAFDIVDSAYTNLNHQQADRPTQKWLMEHCWEYGFILRYPENSTDITGIIWEPWHYRYVGLELAKEIHDLGNITLETYLDNLTNDGTTCGGKLVVLD